MRSIINQACQSLITCLHNCVHTWIWTPHSYATMWAMLIWDELSSLALHLEVFEIRTTISEEFIVEAFIMWSQKSWDRKCFNSLTHVAAAGSALLNKPRWGTLALCGCGFLFMWRMLRTCLFLTALGGWNDLLVLDCLTRTILLGSTAVWTWEGQISCVWRCGDVYSLLGDIFHKG